LYEKAIREVLLGVGGFGLGANFTAILAHLTTSATERYAPDMSGVFTTSGQVAGTIGVAAFGTLYLGQISHPGASEATHAFALIAAAFALVASASAVIAHRATHAARRSDH
jgi:dihydroxyacetone kinase